MNEYSYIIKMVPSVDMTFNFSVRTITNDHLAIKSKLDKMG